MPYSYNEVGAISPGQAIAVPFPYLNRDHVSVTVIGEPVSESLWSWSNNNLITVLEGFPQGITRVKRITPVSERLANLIGAAVLDFDGINQNDLQLLYAMQERIDHAEETDQELQDLRHFVENLEGYINDLGAYFLGFYTSDLNAANANPDRIPGSRYFNTLLGRDRIWTGAVWDDVGFGDMFSNYYDPEGREERVAFSSDLGTAAYVPVGTFATAEQGEIAEQAAEDATVAITNANTSLAQSNLAVTIANNAAGTMMVVTWAELLAVNGGHNLRTGRATGPDNTDYNGGGAGTHTDPVTGLTVSNVGEYSFYLSTPGWRWMREESTFDTITETTGVADANKITATNGDGVLDLSLVQAALPTITTDPTVSGSTLWVEDFAGNVSPAGDGNVYQNDDNDEIIFGDLVRFSKGGDQEEDLYVEDSAGNVHVFGSSSSSSSVPATVSTYGSKWWDNGEVEQADAIGVAETHRRMTQDLSGFTSYIAGYNGVSFEGQSFMQEDGTSGLFYTLARAIRMGWSNPGLTVGPDARPYAIGPNFMPYGGGNSMRTFYPVTENFVGGSEDDLIYPDAQVAIGNVPSNARSGDRAAVFSFVFGWLCRVHFQQALLPTDRNPVLMNKSKGGALLSDILGPGSDGLARFLHMHTVFNEAVAAGPNPSWAKQWLVTIMSHGQADESAGTSGIIAALVAAMDTTWADIQSKTTQIKRPPWLMSQVGSDRGTAAMMYAKQQLAMSKTLTGTEAFAFLHSSTTEIPTLKDASMPVESGNSHPILPGKVLAGIRDAIAAYYILILRQPYFIPYVQKYTRDGERGLAVIANMTGGLKASSLPYGCTQRFMPHLGFEDQNTSGGDADTPIDAHIIDHAKGLVEFKFGTSKSGTGRQISAGGNNGSSQSGQVFIRDTFDIEQPITIPFDERMRRWHNPLFGQVGDTGEGYLETPGAANLSRGGYVNQVAGIADCKIELGNPCARDIVASTPLE